MGAVYGNRRRFMADLFSNRKVNKGGNMTNEEKLENLTNERLLDDMEFAIMIARLKYWAYSSEYQWQRFIREEQ